MASFCATIIKLFGFRATFVTFANNLGFFGEVDRHALIEGIKRTFPKLFIAVCISLSDNAALNLVNLFKATINHYCRKNFAANSTGAIGHNRLIL